MCLKSEAVVWTHITCTEPLLGLSTSRDRESKAAIVTHHREKPQIFVELVQILKKKTACTGIWQSVLVNYKRGGKERVMISISQ